MPAVREAVKLRKRPFGHDSITLVVVARVVKSFVVIEHWG